MLNKLIIQSRLTLIHDCIEQLMRLGAMRRADFVGNKDIVAATESYLRRSLEAIFDVGRHILARSGGADLATEYKGIAKGLGDRGVVSQRLATTLVAMAGYRNRLVHLYHHVQDEELYEILQSDLRDIELFVCEITAYMERVGGAAIE
ncbi:MAG: hypothetical protein DDT37_01430 [Firmicutes bacterium]|nr:hypothetical protein [candidate division NPL-UPA2 bacterium]MBT9153478.1 hypothetical protein [candidate division NPL-UPA2 bacterium]MBT9156444.1 hypothetical protein [candidate division NPL-UPA2 bacterium]